MFLVSSNPRKLAEFARYGLTLDLRPGLDLPEVAGTPEQVAIYKALAAGVGAVVEDTILYVNNQPWVDVRWALDEVRAHAGAPSVWRTTLAYNDGKAVSLFVGQISGTLVCPDHIRPGAFGFDPYFQPHGYAQTLDELECQGRKDEVSARLIAARNLMSRLAMHVFPVDQIEPWRGGFQNS